MPIIESTPFKSPLVQFNHHLQTIFPSNFRKVKGVSYRRERVTTPDNDFLDLDFSEIGSDKIVIATHGLEGSSDRHYIKGIVKVFNKNGWDACGWNCRSCSGEMNRLPRFYHHADTPDLAFVIDHIQNKGKYKKIVLVGFSMGGSLTLKYLGERSNYVYSNIICGIGFSVPCDLTSCALELEKKANHIYNKRFLKKLSKKIRLKAKLMPDKITDKYLNEMKMTSCRQFDDYYSAPLHGFKDAADFYLKASSKRYLSGIKTPTLIVNAINDPFLSGDCYPEKWAKENENIFLEMPENGGHVGFQIRGQEESYAELRALSFVQNYI